MIQCIICGIWTAKGKLIYTIISDGRATTPVCRHYVLEHEHHKYLKPDEVLARVVQEEDEA